MKDALIYPQEEQAEVCAWFSGIMTQLESMAKRKAARKVGLGQCVLQFWLSPTVIVFVQPIQMRKDEDEEEVEEVAEIPLEHLSFQRAAVIAQITQTNLKSLVRCDVPLSADAFGPWALPAEEYD